jgi:hypothetical protein
MILLVRASGDMGSVVIESEGERGDSSPKPALSLSFRDRRAGKILLNVRLERLDLCRAPFILGLLLGLNPSKLSALRSEATSELAESDMVAQQKLVFPNG